MVPTKYPRDTYLQRRPSLGFGSIIKSKQLSVKPSLDPKSTLSFKEPSLSASTPHAQQESSMSGQLVIYITTCTKNPSHSNLIETQWPAKIWFRCYNRVKANGYFIVNCYLFVQGFTILVVFCLVTGDF